MSMYSPQAPMGAAMPGARPGGGMMGNPRNALVQAIMRQRGMGGNMGAGMMGARPPMPGGMPGAGMTPPPGMPPSGAGMNAFNTQMANMAPPPGAAPAGPGAPTSLAPPPTPGAAPPGGMSQMFNQQGQLPPLY